jgi:hypothetical protein
MLEAVDAELWTADQTLRFWGFEVGARMTVARLADGGLWLHSPIEPTDALRAAVDALGPVRHLVAPNRYHHLFIGHWQKTHAAAAAWAALGLPKKRPDVTFTGVLGDGDASPWSAEIDQVAWRGSPMLNEVAFFHRATRTLIVSDLVHNVGREKPLSSRVFYTLVGGWGGLKTNLLDRAAVRDRAAARASLERILAWDFRRIVMAHGRIVEDTGPEALARAYAWLR